MATSALQDERTQVRKQMNNNDTALDHLETFYGKGEPISMLPANYSSNVRPPPPKKPLMADPQALERDAMIFFGQEPTVKDASDSNNPTFKRNMAAFYGSLGDEDELVPFDQVIQGGSLKLPNNEANRMAASMQQKPQSFSRRKVQQEKVDYKTVEGGILGGYPQDKSSKKSLYQSMVQPGPSNADLYKEEDGLGKAKKAKPLKPLKNTNPYEDIYFTSNHIYGTKFLMEY